MKLLLCLIFAVKSLTGYTQLTMLADGGNRKAMIGQRIGITDVTIRYDRPGVKGREGKIWGDLVPFGFHDQGFGTSKAAPWRAGANESTTIEFSTDVSIEGKPVPAGKYGFYIAVGKEESTLIFSKNNTAWGSFFYDSSEDLVRVNVRQHQMDYSEEWLKYEFLHPTDSSAIVELIWERWNFPFTISVDLVKTQMASFKRELQTDIGFDWRPWASASEWAVKNKGDLQQALQWADYSVSGPFIGQKNFRTLKAKASVLAKMGRRDEATVLMKEAVGLGNENDLHLYGRELLTVRDIKGATEVFQLNYNNHPNTFTTNMGMTRAMSANGKYKEAIQYLKAAELLAPDEENKKSIEKMQKTLSEGKDINK